jgi:hypothetical protein
MPYAGYHLPCPDLVNSHLLVLLANHMRPVEGSQRAGVELGDTVGDCQEEDYNQESLFHSSENIQEPHWAALGRGIQDFIERKRLKSAQLSTLKFRYLTYFQDCSLAGQFWR